MDKVPRRLFVAWFGDAPLSDTRQNSLRALEEMSIPVILVTQENIGEWVLPEDPLPEGWMYLTAIQQADFLRCYLMHHHGGGYADIKAPSGEWDSSFEILDSGDLWAAGYPEYWWGVANLGTSHFEFRSADWWRCRIMQARFRSLIGNGAFIFKPRTPLTRQWLDLTTAKLESLTPALRKRPARASRERAGEVIDNVVCDYPVSWTALGGDILHPLVLKYRKKIVKTLPRPKIESYL